MCLMKIFPVLKVFISSKNLSFICYARLCAGYFYIKSSPKENFPIKQAKALRQTILFVHAVRLFLLYRFYTAVFCFFPFQMYYYFFIQCRNAGSRKASAKIHASTFDRQIPIYPNIGASTIPAMVLAAISSTPAVMAKLENPIP